MEMKQEPVSTAGNPTLAQVAASAAVAPSSGTNNNNKKNEGKQALITLGSNAAMVIRDLERLIDTSPIIRRYRPDMVNKERVGRIARANLESEYQDHIGSDAHTNAYNLLGGLFVAVLVFPSFKPDDKHLWRTVEYAFSELAAVIRSNASTHFDVCNKMVDLVVEHGITSANFGDVLIQCCHDKKARQEAILDDHACRHLVVFCDVFAIIFKRSFSVDNHMRSLMQVFNSAVSVFPEKDAVNFRAINLDNQTVSSSTLAVVFGRKDNDKLSNQKGVSVKINAEGGVDAILDFVKNVLAPTGYPVAHDGDETVSSLTKLCETIGTIFDVDPEKAEKHFTDETATKIFKAINKNGDIAILRTFTTNADVAAVDFAAELAEVTIATNDDGAEHVETPDAVRVGPCVYTGFNINAFKNLLERTVFCDHKVQTSVLNVARICALSRVARALKSEIGAATRKAKEAEKKAARKAKAQQEPAGDMVVKKTKKVKKYKARSAAPGTMAKKAEKAKKGSKRATSLEQLVAHDRSNKLVAVDTTLLLEGDEEQYDNLIRNIQILSHIRHLRKLVHDRLFQEYPVEHKWARVYCEIDARIAVMSAEIDGLVTLLAESDAEGFNQDIPSIKAAVVGGSTSTRGDLKKRMSGLKKRVSDALSICDRDSARYLSYRTISLLKKVEGDLQTLSEFYNALDREESLEDAIQEMWKKTAEYKFKRAIDDGLFNLPEDHSYETTIKRRLESRERAKAKRKQKKQSVAATTTDTFKSSEMVVSADEEEGVIVTPSQPATTDSVVVSKPSSAVSDSSSSEASDMVITVNQVAVASTDDDAEPAAKKAKADVVAVDTSTAVSTSVDSGSGSLPTSVTESGAKSPAPIDHVVNDDGTKTFHSLTDQLDYERFNGTYESDDEEEEAAEPVEEAAEPVEEAAEPVDESEDESDNDADDESDEGSDDDEDSDNEDAIPFDDAELGDSADDSDFDIEVAEEADDEAEKAYADKTGSDAGSDLEYDPFSGSDEDSAESDAVFDPEEWEECMVNPYWRDDDVIRGPRFYLHRLKAREDVEFLELEDAFFQKRYKQLVREWELKNPEPASGDEDLMQAYQKERAAACKRIYAEICENHAQELYEEAAKRMAEIAKECASGEEAGSDEEPSGTMDESEDEE